jgi:hypothetical protein
VLRAPCSKTTVSGQFPRWTSYQAGEVVTDDERTGSGGHPSAACRPSGWVPRRAARRHSHNGRGMTACLRSVTPRDASQKSYRMALEQRGRQEHQAAGEDHSCWAWDRPFGISERSPVKTNNVDKLLGRFSAKECHTAAEELERYLDAGFPATRELLAAFLNDLNDECLIRWGPAGERGQAAGLPGPPA